MEISDNRKKVKDKAESFLSSVTDGVYLYGINKYSKSLMNLLELSQIKINGFIDDFTTSKEYEGYTIYKIKSISKNDAVINCIVDARPIDALNKIQEQGVEHYSDYYALQALHNTELLQIDYLAETNSIWNNTEYINLYNLLADEVSRQTLEKVSNFRLNRNIEDMRAFSFRINEQYFEDFITLPQEPVFIDGGGFDGTTTEKFIELYPSFDTIHYFEPIETMFEKSKNLFKDFYNIVFYKKGIWNRSTILNFSNSQGSASKISEEGEIKIEVTSLDEVIQGKVDFIKLDIEGAEYEAILGAEQLIKNYKPKIAVCVYHNQNDFIRIPSLVLSFNSDYKIYLRHYTQGMLETVMFFV